jgi:hypothetical protein
VRSQSQSVDPEAWTVSRRYLSGAKLKKFIPIKSQHLGTVTYSHQKEIDEMAEEPV